MATTGVFQRGCTQATALKKWPSSASAKAIFGLHNSELNTVLAALAATKAVTNFAAPSPSTRPIAVAANAGDEATSPSVSAWKNPRLTAR